MKTGCDDFIIGLILLGLLAGYLSGLVGIGGGIADGSGLGFTLRIY